MAPLVETFLRWSFTCKDFVDAAQEVLVALSEFLGDAAPRQLLLQFHSGGLQRLHQLVVDRTFHFLQPVAQISVPLVVPAITTEVKLLTGYTVSGDLHDFDDHVAGVLGDSISAHLAFFSRSIKYANKD